MEEEKLKVEKRLYNLEKAGFSTNLFFIHPLTSISSTLHLLASGEIGSTDEDHGGQQVEEERVFHQQGLLGALCKL